MKYLSSFFAIEILLWCIISYHSTPHIVAFMNSENKKNTLSIVQRTNKFILEFWERINKSAEDTPGAIPFISTWSTNDNCNDNHDHDHFYSDNCHDENTTLTIDAAQELYQSTFEFDYQVDWGDGSFDSGITEKISHRYKHPGTYKVSISGDYPMLKLDCYGNRNSFKLISVEQWGNIQWKSMEEAFKDCSDFDIKASDVPDLSLTTSMSYMFSKAGKFNSYIGHWDVSNVANMSHMFNGAKAFNQPIGNWNVSNVSDMSYMFRDAKAFNQPIGSWNVSNASDMSSMFEGTNAFNQPIGSWNVSNVSDMGSIFEDAKAFNQPIDHWNLSSAWNLSYMFKGAKAFNQPIKTWNVSNARWMNSMFEDAKKLFHNFLIVIKIQAI